MVSVHELEHRSAGDGLGELSVESGELSVLCFDLLVLAANLNVLFGQTRIGGIETVYLTNIVLHHGTHGGQLFLEFGYTAGIAGLGLTQLFQQILYALLFLREQVLQRVVADIQILIAVELDGKVFILFLQFLFLDFHLLDQFGQFITLAEVHVNQCSDDSHEHTYYYPNKSFVFHLISTE